MQTQKKALISIAIFVGVIILDLLTKRFALSSEPSRILGLIDVGTFVKAKDAIAQDDPNAMIRAIHYATFLGPLLLVYFFLLSQVVKKASYQRFLPWLTLWVAGLVANVFDRMFYGQVVHWLKIKSLTFNLASIAVVVGIVMCVYHLIKQRKSIFAFYWQRKMRMTHPKFQSFYILNIVAISCFLSISLLVFAYTFMKFYMFQYGIIIPQPMLRLFLIEFGLIVVIFMAILLLIGMYYSSKVAGPFFAFQNYIEKLKQGENPTFVLREDDDFKELEELAKDIKDNWKS